MVRIKKYTQDSLGVVFQIEYTTDLGFLKTSEIRASSPQEGLIHYKNCIIELLFMHSSNLLHICNKQNIVFEIKLKLLLHAFVETRDVSLVHCIASKIDSIISVQNIENKFHNILLGKIRSFKECYSKLNQAIDHQNSL